MPCAAFSADSGRSAGWPARRLTEQLAPQAAGAAAVGVGPLRGVQEVAGGGRLVQVCQADRQIAEQLGVVGPRLQRPGLEL